MSSSSDVSPAELGFEEALTKLEALLEQMESEELPLEAMLGKYEEGQKLIEICQSRLTAAEIRIRQIQKDAGGRITARNLEQEESTSDIETA